MKKDSSAIDVIQDDIIKFGTPSVRDIVAAALTFGTSSATCESSVFTLSRILTDYRRSLLQIRKSCLVVLSFESDLTSRLTYVSLKESSLHKFNNMSTRRLQLY